MELPTLALAFGKSLLLALAAVLPILNPPASAPVFVNLTRGLDGRVRRALARRIGLNVILMLSGAMVIGTAGSEEGIADAYISKPNGLMQISEFANWLDRRHWPAR